METRRKRRPRGKPLSDKPWHFTDPAQVTAIHGEGRGKDLYFMDDGSIRNSQGVPMPLNLRKLQEACSFELAPYMVDAVIAHVSKHAAYKHTERLRKAQEAAMRKEMDLIAAEEAAMEKAYGEEARKAVTDEDAEDIDFAALEEVVLDKVRKPKGKGKKAQSAPDSKG